MSIADKLGDFFLEKDPAKDNRSTPATPTRGIVAPVNPFYTPEPRPPSDRESAGMLETLSKRRSTVAGWDSVVALKAACGSLAEFIPDKNAQLRAALKTQRLDVSTLIDVYTGALNVLANEDVRFKQQIKEERAKSTPLQQKNIDAVAVDLAAAKQKVADLTERLATMRNDVQRLENQLASTEAAFASALTSIRDDTNQDLEQLRNLK